MKGDDNRYTLKAPCSNCPFRADRSFHLHPDRVDEIADSLLSGNEFWCHKTVDYTDGDGERASRTRACAGARATLECEGLSTQLQQITERFGGTVAELDPDLPVYESINTWREAMKRVDHHENS